MVILFSFFSFLVFFFLASVFHFFSSPFQSAVSQVFDICYQNDRLEKMLSSWKFDASRNLSQNFLFFFAKK